MTEVSNGHAAMAGDDLGRTVSVAEVADRMGVSARTVRRYIKAGTLPGELVTTTKGTEWRVPAAAVVAAVNGRASAATDGDASEPSEDDRGRPESMAAPAVRSGRGEVAPLLRALDLLAERDRRITQLEQERFELAGRLGYFQAELEHAQDTIKALQAPAPTPSEPAMPATSAPPEPARPWWRFW